MPGASQRSCCCCCCSSCCCKFARSKLFLLGASSAFDFGELEGSLEARGAPLSLDSPLPSEYGFFDAGFADRGSELLSPRRRSDPAWTPSLGSGAQSCGPLPLLWPTEIAESSPADFALPAELERLLGCSFSRAAVVLLGLSRERRRRRRWGSSKPSVSPETSSEAGAGSGALSAAFSAAFSAPTSEVVASATSGDDAEAGTGRGCGWGWD